MDRRLWKQYLLLRAVITWIVGSYNFYSAFDMWYNCLLVKDCVSLRVKFHTVPKSNLQPFLDCSFSIKMNWLFHDWYFKNVTRSNNWKASFHWWPVRATYLIPKLAMVTFKDALWTFKSWLALEMWVCCGISTVLLLTSTHKVFSGYGGSVVI